MFNKRIEYPCTKCHIKQCFIICAKYRTWFKSEWLFVTEPFREIARQRDKERDDQK